MSIVAISETAGSMGIEIGRKLAESLGWEFADREILSKASEQFGEDLTDLRHSVEEKPTLWERFSDTQHRYKAYVEAIMLEMAARDNVVLAGRSSTIVLRQVPHVVRVRTSAPEHTRAHRLENEMGLTYEAALNYVRHSDRERAARVKFLYQLDVDDSLLYDLVLTTERLTVEKGAALHPYWPVRRISLDRLEIEGQDAALTRRARGRNLFQSSAIGCSGEVVNAPGSWRVRRPR